ncbi:hypothetical protein E2562_031849 [Oryza meyeriana var. granulata]|uniref:Uncharacterized protein n=1 Tax=Oryza meyeriana var. granulata TaxID=110450 RepID=A0A6G1C1T6_9ORYZ|nr:hypothetical protein E2562_031849 [Oryza meyeriana var. granulata]
MPRRPASSRRRPFAPQARSRRCLRHPASAAAPSNATLSRAGSPRPHHHVHRVEQRLGVPLLDANHCRNAAVVFNPRSSPSPPRHPAVTAPSLASAGIVASSLLLLSPATTARSRRGSSPPPLLGGRRRCRAVDRRCRHLLLKSPSASSFSLAAGEHPTVPHGISSMFVVIAIVYLKHPNFYSSVRSGRLLSVLPLVAVVVIAFFLISCRSQLADASPPCHHQP